MKKPPKRQFALLGAEALGGHHARRGFRFQDRWIAWNLMTWITQEEFRGIVNEGVDDVDVSWFDRKSARKKSDRPRSAYDWEIFQLKDSAVSPKMLSEVLEAFRRKHSQFPDTWSRYHLIATRCAERLSSLPLLLRQTRAYLLNHGGDTPVGKAAVGEFQEKVVKLGVKSDVSFLIDHVNLEFSESLFGGNNERFERHFDLLLLGHGIPFDRSANARAELYELISSQKVGSLLTRQSVLELLGRYRAKPELESRSSVAKSTGTTLPVEATSIRPTFVSVNLRPELSCQISVFPGGAVLVRLPDGTHGLVDCGMAAASKIIPYLAERDVHELDFVALTHWHSDRYNGLPSVISSMKHVGRILIPRSHVGPVASRMIDHLADYESRNPGTVEILGARAVIYETARLGEAPVATVEALLPIGSDEPAPNLSAVNDSCVLFRVSIGKRSFLITADATIRLWTNLFKTVGGRHVFPRSDGLTVPRHGSKHSLNKEILSAIAEPSGFYAVLDPEPRFGLPDAQAVDLIRTGHGEILICEDVPVHLMLTRDGLFDQRAPAR